MSGEQMTFPGRIEHFLRDYSFEDKRQIYTNGARLIPLYRVQQALEHYYPSPDAVEVRHGRWILDDETGVPICSECRSGKPTQCVCSSVIQHNLKNYEIRYCYYCGAKMDGGVYDD